MFSLIGRNRLVVRSMPPVNAAHLLVRVFVRLQRLHDGELCVVLETPRLVPQDLLQDSESQSPDRVLQEEGHFKIKASYLTSVSSYPGDGRSLSCQMII